MNFYRRKADGGMRKYEKCAFVQDDGITETLYTWLQDAIYYNLQITY